MLRNFALYFDFFFESSVTDEGFVRRSKHKITILVSIMSLVLALICTLFLSRNVFMKAIFLSFQYKREIWLTIQTGSPLFSFLLIICIRQLLSHSQFLCMLCVLFYSSSVFLLFRFVSSYI